MNKQLKIKFVRLDSQMQPENLYEDGEISNAEADRKYADLQLQWQALEKQACQLVEEDSEEIWGWAKELTNEEIYGK